MRVLTITRHRPRHRSLTGALALALAAVCLVQLHLLLRPHSGCRSEDALVAGGAPFSGAPHSAAFGGGAAAAPRPRSLAELRGARLAMVSFANGAFTDMITNWALSVQRLGLPFVVGALDARMAEVATQRGWLHLNVSALVAGDSGLFRSNFARFRNMGATKVQLVLTMLEELGVETVVVSDSDTAWLRDPAEYLAQWPAADFFISTDCLSHEVEAAWQPQHNQPRCGHVAGNGWGRAFNTGVFAARNRPAARRLLEQWRDLLLDPSRTTEERASVQGTTATLGVTDQLAMHYLLEEGVGLMEALPGQPRVLSLRNRTLALHPLPVLLFPSGHVAFVQHTPWRHGVDPYVVHATFQRFGTALHAQGKRGRFRELGLWFLDGEAPGYYDAPGARYLTYDNDVRQAVAAAEAQRGPLPALARHMVAAAFQLALFRDALAAARMLNRTLVLPPSWAYCDLDWTPDVLETCRIRGTDTQLPFQCPSDFIFHVPLLDQNGLAYRMPGFLQQPQVPERVRRWQAEVQVLQAAPPQAAAAVSRAASVLWLGMSQQELLAATAPLAEAAVISIRGMRPGLLRGFSAAAEQVAFDALFQNITRTDASWCCGAVGDAQRAHFAYRLPRPFGEGYAPWEPPALQLPHYCDQPHPDKRNEMYAQWANHPCTFLRNATAAAEAAGLSTA